MYDRKGMATCRQVGLFEREVRFRPSGAAVEILLDAAHVMSEGERRGDAYFGSTMVTIDLGNLAAILRDAGEPDNARRLALILVDDPYARRRLEAWALRDAAARAGIAVASHKCDVRGRAAGTRLYLDVDLEADLAVPKPEPAPAPEPIPEPMPVVHSRPRLEVVR